MGYSNLNLTDNEKQIFGAVIYDPDKYKYLLDRLKAQDFPSVEAKGIYCTIKAGEYNPQKIAEINKVKIVDIATLPGEVVSYSLLDSIADVLIRDGTVRSARQYMFEKAREVPETTTDCSAYITEAIDFFIELRQRLKPRIGITRMQDIAKELFDDLVYALDNKDEFLNLPFPRLNETIGRLVPGQIITFAGRPGSGKSAMALQIARALSKKCVLLYITLEMLGSEHVRRIVAAKTGVSVVDIVGGNVGNTKASEVANELSKIVNDNLIFSSDTRTVADIGLYIKEHNPSVVVIDSVNLLKSQGESERIRITNVTRELKEVASLNRITIIQICQLNRGAEGQWKANLAEIKESGSIEEDSDVVVLLSELREEHENILNEYDSVYFRKYRRNLIREGEFQKMIDNGNKFIMMNVAKNRNGARQIIPTIFYAKKFTFEELPIMFGEHYER